MADKFETLYKSITDMIEKTDIEEANKKVVISTILQAQTFTSLKKLCGKKYLKVSGCSAGSITGTTEEKKQQILNLIINHLFPGSQQELVKISKPKQELIKISKPKQKKVSGEKTVTDLKNELKEKGITKNIKKLTDNKKDNLQKLLKQQRCNEDTDYSTCPNDESCFIENKLCVDKNIDKVGSLERRKIHKGGKIFYVLSTKKEAQQLQDKILIDEETDTEDESESPNIPIATKISSPSDSDSDSDSDSERPYIPTATQVSPSDSDSEEEEESARLMLFRQEGMLDVARDGNCFFICISELLKICYDVDVSYNTCRQHICDMLVILFAMYPYWNDSLVHQTPEEYIEEMRQDSSWGGEFEIISACVLYNVSINISYEQENTPNTMFPNINKEYKIRDQQFHNRAIHSTPIYTPIWGLYHTGVVDNAGTHYQYNRNVYSTNIQFNNSSFNGTNCSSLPYNKLNTEYKDQYYTKLNAEYMNQYYNHLISKIEQTYSPDRFQSPSPIASMQSSPSSPLKPAPRYVRPVSPPIYSSPEYSPELASPSPMASIQSSPSPPLIPAPRYVRPVPPPVYTPGSIPEFKSQSPMQSPELNPVQVLMSIKNQKLAKQYIKDNFVQKERNRMFKRWEKENKKTARYVKPEPIKPRKKTGKVTMTYPSQYRRLTPEEVLEIPTDLSEMNVSPGLQEELRGEQNIENIEEVNEKVSDIMSGLSDQFS